MSENKKVFQKEIVDLAGSLEALVNLHAMLQKGSFPVSTHLQAISAFKFVESLHEIQTKLFQDHPQYEEFMASRAQPKTEGQE